MIRTDNEEYFGIGLICIRLFEFQNKKKKNEKMETFFEYGDGVLKEDFTQFTKNPRESDRCGTFIEFILKSKKEMPFHQNSKQSSTLLHIEICLFVQHKSIQMYERTASLH